jgi:hypothetical protein
MADLSMERARALADELRPIWPEKAAELDAAIAAIEGANRDGLKVSGSIYIKLEKFDGEYHPGMKPVEVIETEEPLFEKRNAR